MLRRGNLNRRFTRQVPEACFLAVAILATGYGISDLWPKSNSQPVKDVASYLGRSPHSVKFNPVAVPLPISDEQLRLLADRVVKSAAEPGQGTSALLHATRLSAIVGPEVAEWMVRDEARRIVRLNLNSNVLQDSWRGIEVRRGEDGERSEHRDQLLAALAQFGIHLTCAVGDAPTSDRPSVQVRDLLRTSISEFHLNQAELSWTATAYALYLPPQLYWFNRFGERFDFDDLVVALMDKPLQSESCSGTHLMQTLAVLLQVDQDAKILSEDTRGKLHQYLALRVQEAVDSQLPDGSWPVYWSKSGFDATSSMRATPKATFSRRLTIAGHLLEWFQLLPVDHQPPEATIKRGLLWMTPQLLAMNDSHFPDEICPCTHALLAVEGSLRCNSQSVASAPR